MRTEAKSKAQVRDAAVQVDYVILTMGDRYKAVDVVTEGSSMTKNYYDQFNRMLTTPAQGFPYLVQKLKDKWTSRKRRTLAREPSQRQPATAAASPDGPERKIIRARRYAVRSLTVKDAAREVSGGDLTLLVFRNAATDSLNVLFRRTDGNLGLFEPEA